MNRAASHIADTLDQLQRGLADLALDRMLEVDPTLLHRYGAAARSIWRAELANRLAHLVQAVAVERSVLFTNNALWARAALAARDVSPQDFFLHLDALQHVLAQELPAEAAAIVAVHILAARDAAATHPAELPSLLDDAAQDSTLARLYLLHLLQRDQDEAGRLVIEARRNGMPLADVYTRVIMPALIEIGRMWNMQEASIADEHFCTAATQRIMARLRLDLPRHAWNGNRALCCGVGGDMHDVGIRMVADLLELDGWQVEYLGANTPVAEVEMTLANPEAPFDLLAVSGSTTLSVRSVAELISAVRATPAGAKLPILVGGCPFCAVPDLWQAVGADASAACAVNAVERAKSLVE